MVKADFAQWSYLVIKSTGKRGASNKSHGSMIQTAYEITLWSGVLLLTLVFALGAVTWTLHALGVVVGRLHLQLAVVVAVLVPMELCRRRGVGRLVPICSTLIGIAAVCTALVVATSIFDKSYDGQAYHQEAIIQLGEGWNPLRTELDSEIPHSIWLNHYPKGPWLAAATVYVATGNIEAGKAVNLLLLASSFLFCLALLMKLPNFRLWLALPLAFVAAFNPVSLYQSFSYYVDGQLSSLLLTLTCLCALTFFEPRRSVFIALFMSIVLVVNVKFTGAVYAAMIIAAFGGALLMTSDFRAVAAKGGSAGIAWLVGVGLFGFNPYVTNTLGNGHPFHLLMGEQAMEPLTGSTVSGSAVTPDADDYRTRLRGDWPDRGEKRKRSLRAARRATERSASNI